MLGNIRHARALCVCECKLAPLVGTGTSLEYPLGLKIDIKPPNLKIPNTSAVFEQPNGIQMDHVKLKTDKGKQSPVHEVHHRPPNRKSNISIGTQTCSHFRDANSHRHIPMKPLAESNPSLSCCAVSANQRNAVLHCVVFVSELSQNATSTLFTSCTQDEF